MFKNLLNNMPKSWPISAFFGGATTVVLVSFVGVETHSLAFSLMAAATLTAIVLYFLARYEAGLNARVTGDAPFVWDIWLNDIMIGYISDSEYAAMQRHAIVDARLIFAQLLNLGYVLLNVARSACAMVPRLIIWLAVAATFAMPEVLTDLVLAWRNAEPDALIAGLRNLFELAALGSVLWVAFRAMNGHRFGFRNQYDKAVGRSIRQQLGTPADGALRLTKWSRMASERMAAVSR